jgi:hypothetical protein
MSNIRNLPGASLPMGEPAPDTIKLLEELLERARSGDLRSIAVAYTVGDHAMRTDWNNEHEFMELIGGVAWLQSRMVDALNTE